MNTSPKKVLVVDDDQAAVPFVRAALGSEGYEVFGASDGLAGLAWAREKVPDLIILDVYMPRQPGLYTLRDLKTDARTKDIPVIILTAVGRELGATFGTKDIHNVLGIEPEVFLEKPIDPTYLRAVTDRLLGNDSATNGQGT